MTTPEKAEPERSAISSTDCRHCLTHPHLGPHTNGKCCLCGATREGLDEPKKCGYAEHDFKPFQGYRDEPGEPHCLTCGHTQSECAQHLTEQPECEHPNKLYTGSVYDGPGGRKTWLYYTCPDCKAHLKEEELDEPEPRCTCGPDEACSECPEAPGVVHKHVYAYQTGGVFKCSCGAVRLLTDPGEEPPLTPEEEEMVSGYEELAEHAAGAAQDALKDDWTPPQPDRRPPYLLAYSVQGHLYEIALPGDATVAALDGRLVITHQLGPVAGICQIAPITSEESA